MIQTVNNSEFHNAFNRMDRGSQFSYEALNLIYEYLEQFEEDTGEPVELDVIAICCEYSEMTVQEVIDSYGYKLDSSETEYDLDKLVEILSEDTTVLGTTDSTIVFAQF
jgi:division protein CdvB (Snf7/Vps24/ESCRT-III family)